MKLLTLLSLILTVSLLAEPKTIPLYPDLDPSLKSSETIKPEGPKKQPFVINVKYPLLTIHLPANATKTTPAIIICPGGAYAGLAIDKEGNDVAEWLNTVGVAGIVLKYRMPVYEQTKEGTPLPLLDAREALRQVHASAKEWNIDEKHIGIMGFSAGGHLAATVLTHPSDDANQNANFGVLVYPVVSMMPPVTHEGSRTNLLGKEPTPEMQNLYSNELHVTKNTPPVFIVHASNDPVKPMNSVLFYQALLSHKVPAEMHLFATGGHGFGLGPEGSEVSQWPVLCAKWMQTEKILSK